jgi:hypothetical protein
MVSRIPLMTMLLLIGLSSGLARAQSAAGGSFDFEARWSQYLHRTFGPHRLGMLAVESAVDHGLGDPHCWDSSGAGYIQRFARAFDRRMIRNTTEFATGVLTGEDLRYRQSRSRSIQGRVWTALRSSVVAKMPDGSERPAYTRFFASAATEVSTAHWVGQPIRTQWVFQSVGWSLLDQAQTNLLDEFSPDFRVMGARLWSAARGRTRRHRQPVIPEKNASE